MRAKNLPECCKFVRNSNLNVEMLSKARYHKVVAWISVTESAKSCHESEKIVDRLGLT